MVLRQRPQALEDIVRADAPDTLKYCADQGVVVKVISGDNNVTVGAVARRAGLEDWESNVNAYTDDDPELCDPIFGALPYRLARCRIVREREDTTPSTPPVMG